MAVSTEQGPRIAVATPREAADLVRVASDTVQEHFKLVGKGMALIPDDQVPPEHDRNSWSHELVGALALSPEIFNVWWEEEYVALKRGQVSPRIKELVALRVAVRNGCRLCTAYHAGAARSEGAKEAEVEAVLDFDRRGGELDGACAPRSSSASRRRSRRATWVRKGSSASARPATATSRSLSWPRRRCSRTSCRA